jgi:hypothetical protein
MTTNAMSCEAFTDRLMDYLEHETDDATRSAIEKHSVSCGECGALLADLRKLRVDAANLPPMQPSRDLWAGIAARIEAPVVPIGGTPQVAQPSVAVRRWTRVALIAASLVAAAGVGYLAGGVQRGAELVSVPPVAVLPESLPPQVVAVPESLPNGQATPERVAVAPVPPPGVGAPAAAPARSPEVQIAFATMTADYDREIARLRTLIEQRRNQLDPATVAIIEKNLLVIDTAIADCKKAIAGDPSSRFLIESLNQSLRSKVELMRTAALLPSRT